MTQPMGRGARQHGGLRLPFRPAGAQAFGGEREGRQHLVLKGTEVSAARSELKETAVRHADASARQQAELQALTQRRDAADKKRTKLIGELSSVRAELGESVLRAERAEAEVMVTRRLVEEIKKAASRKSPSNWRTVKGILATSSAPICPSHQLATCDLARNLRMPADPQVRCRSSGAHRHA